MSEILDVCCGGRMWWSDKADARAVYMDNRELECTLCDGRAFRVAPDVVGDFRNIPFADGSFAMVLFDPPHLKNVGKNAWTAKKYGILGDDWRDDLRRGFAECFRILRLLELLAEASAAESFMLQAWDSCGFGAEDE